MTIPRKKLRFKFEIAVKHLNLSKEEIDAAWVSATADPINAYRCYSAIVRTL
jgi:hypothetical protein